MIKKILPILTASALAAGITANAADTISVTVDGTELSFDVMPQLIDNRTMVPMRAIFEALGAEVSWDQSTATATGTKDGTSVSITVNDNRLIKNGTVIELDVPAQLVDSRTLVPVRAISEAFDCDVEWNGDTHTVAISTADASFNSTDNSSYTTTIYDIPPYSGVPYAVVNSNVPYFTADDMTTDSFESYSELDSLGRCGVAYANLCTDTMPTEERGAIGMVKPSGWQLSKYDFVSGKYLYNRCHLIGFQLSGENANEKNLITGTRYLNVEGMLPFENMTADYIKSTGNHVLYRVTPIFDGDNLVADGVLMEALSVEDNGAGISFDVFCYNVQPGVTINYATGENYADGTIQNSSDTSDTADTTYITDTATAAYDSDSVEAIPDTSGSAAYDTYTVTTDSASTSATYILNTNTMKFHYPSCASAAKISDKNRGEYSGSRDELIAEGYSPCGNCKP
jgi:DNA-entry nuclease